RPNQASTIGSVRAVVLVKIEAVQQANHDLGEGEILGEALVGNVDKRFAPCFTERFEILGLQRGDHAGHEGSALRDAVDRFAFRDYFESSSWEGFFSRIC